MIYLILALVDESTEIVAAYSSKEKALQRIKEEEQKCSYIDFRIKTMELIIDTELEG